MEVGGVNAYYNEHDRHAAAWLRELIAGGHIAAGDVDERSIVDVRADDLRGYNQCHFFAGIGGWSYALRLAAWPNDRPVWTGSCPCQPFSVAGKQRGGEDERHLWPAWFRLIRECAPTAIFGEQVSGANGLAWLDHVLADLEGIGYAAAAADMPACGVGAPHIRERLWFVGDAKRPGLEGFAGNGDRAAGWTDENRSTAEAGSGASHWSGANWIACTDGKVRPVEPGTFPLAHGIPGRVGLLRGYGNAIVPQVAAEFIKAYREGERVT